MPHFRFCFRPIIQVMMLTVKCLICYILYIFKYEMVLGTGRREPEEQADQEGKLY